MLPSLLACDFARLEQEIRAVEAARVSALHLDIMDGHFVPNLSIGVPIVEAVRRVTTLPLDVHLMITEPGKYLEPFRRAGADTLTVHIEAAPDPRSLLEEIRDLGALAGLALNPPTPLSAIEPYLSSCDIVLAMSVMPGFGGQPFDESALAKLRSLAAHPQCHALLEIDGGVGLGTIGRCAQAGANLLVAGTAIFGTANYVATIDQLGTEARSTQGTYR